MPTIRKRAKAPKLNCTCPANALEEDCPIGYDSFGHERGATFGRTVEDYQEAMRREAAWSNKVGYRASADMVCRDNLPDGCNCKLRQGHKEKHLHDQRGDRHEPHQYRY